MKEFRLNRVVIGPDGCFGVLSIDERPFAVTLEPAYLAGASSELFRQLRPQWKTKIPAGKYICSRTMFNRGGYETFEIPVEGHSEIKFHIGNTVKDSDGCPLIGLSYYQDYHETVHNYGHVLGRPSIGSSRIGFSRFMWIAGDDKKIQLEIGNNG